MSRWLPVLLLAACAPEIDLARPEDAPVAVILSPSDGSEVRAGRVELRGRVSDPQDLPEHLFVVWSVGDAQSEADGTWQDVCSGFADAAGDSLCVATLTPNTPRVRMLVKDLAGFERRAFLDLTVVSVLAPTVSLLAPDPNGRYHENVPVPLEALVDDADHTLDALQITWTSSELGVFEGPRTADALGRLTGAYRLPQGQHVVTVTVRDPDGAEDVASSVVVVREEDAAPSARIDAPDDGSGVRAHWPVVLRGYVHDREDGSEGVTRAWTSDVDGALGPGTLEGLGATVLSTDTLSVGTHQITLSAEDTNGFRDDDTITLHVDEAPTLDLVAPVDGASFDAGQPVIFSGTVGDATTPAESLVLTLRSDHDGPLGMLSPAADGSFSVAVPGLSAAVHEIQVRVTDGYGIDTFTVLELTVGAP